MSSQKRDVLADGCDDDAKSPRALEEKKTVAARPRSRAMSENRNLARGRGSIR